MFHRLLYWWAYKIISRDFFVTKNGLIIQSHKRAAGCQPLVHANTASNSSKFYTTLEFFNLYLSGCLFIRLNIQIRVNFLFTILYITCTKLKCSAWTKFQNSAKTEQRKRLYFQPHSSPLPKPCKTFTTFLLPQLKEY